MGHQGHVTVYEPRLQYDKRTKIPYFKSSQDYNRRTQNYTCVNRNCFNKQTFTKLLKDHTQNLKAK
jgi:hypothetical protein